MFRSFYVPEEQAYIRLYISRVSFENKRPVGIHQKNMCYFGACYFSLTVDIMVWQQIQMPHFVSIIRSFLIF